MSEFKIVTAGFAVLTLSDCMLAVLVTGGQRCDCDTIALSKLDLCTFERCFEAPPTIVSSKSTESLLLRMIVRFNPLRAPAAPNLTDNGTCPRTYGIVAKDDVMSSDAESDYHG